MATITISRQLGSLGTTLGRKVAVQLGYSLVHRELMNQAARLAGAPDMALATIDELGLLGIEPDETQQKLYLQAVQTVIQNLAQEGNTIIVGRAGQAILQNHPGVLHLRVVAPLATRIQRIVEIHGFSPQAARAQIEASDRYRTDYLRHHYGTGWDDPTLYHLIINTGQLDLEIAADVVCTAARNLADPTSSLETSFE
jgi:cytidylate kinase